MDDDETYNGWKNRETWLTALWFDNERASYEYWCKRTRQIWEDARHSEEVKSGLYSRPEAARLQLALAIGQELDAQSRFVQHDLFSDLLQTAIDEIDCFELAEHYLADFVPAEMDSASRSTPFSKDP